MDKRIEDDLDHGFTILHYTLSKNCHDYQLIEGIHSGEHTHSLRVVLVLAVVGLQLKRNLKALVISPTQILKVYHLRIRRPALQ